MRNIYRSLARNALSKNKLVYMPYIISAIMMITISYVIFAVSSDDVIASIEGGASLQMVMRLGILVMYNISFFFLMGVSCFVIKQRKKELGLYSVLGMQKKHIIRVQFIENFIVYLISAVTGTVVGIVLTKLMQLGILKLYNQEADFGWDIQIGPTIINAAAFAVFFFVFFLINAIGILRTNTLEYMKEQARGEKKPKSNWILAIIGIACLAGGYYLSFRSQSAVDAVNMFFIAVMLVIIGTVALFTAGSITLLNTMKKKKSYYYKTSHFISVSGMLYRMKRNAATLASICIFATSVLVTLSSVVTLYWTVRSLVEERFPVSYTLVYDSEGEDPETYYEKITAGAEKCGVKIDLLMKYKYYNAFGSIDNGFIMTYPSYAAVDTVEVFILPLSTYNESLGSELQLASDEVGIAALSGKIPSGDFSFRTTDPEFNELPDYSSLYHSVPLSEVPLVSYGNSINVIDGIYFVVLPDEEFTNVKPYINPTALEYGDGHTFVSINTSSGRDAQMDFYNELTKNQKDYGYVFENSQVNMVESITGLYGGLFFLGLFLSAAFLTITILNMYFSQIMQGYEDSKRFAIMRKVGLTKKEIKKSVNSQIVVVFILPILVAVIHTAASFPMVNRILVLFGGVKASLFLVILAICIVVFTVVYTVAYLFTRRTYLKLVSGMNM